MDDLAPPPSTGRGGRRPCFERRRHEASRRRVRSKFSADKVALRVSILVQFRVVDPRAAVHVVESCADRLYSDVQLAARRSLASMSLEEILANRNLLSEDVLRDVQGSAAGYSVAIVRTDVKDLIFPGNLQEITNRVLAAERMSQVQLVEARAKAEVQELEAQTKAENGRMAAESRAEAARLAAESKAEAQRIRTAADVEALRRRDEHAEACVRRPRAAPAGGVKRAARVVQARQREDLHRIRQARRRRRTRVIRRTNVGEPRYAPSTSSAGLADGSDGDARYDARRAGDPDACT